MMAKYIKHFSVIIIGYACILSSCYTKNEPYYYDVSETYQIHNALSHPVILNFFENGELKEVYAEIKNGSFNTHLTESDSPVSCEKLWHGVSMKLESGQTALLCRYLSKNTNNIAARYGSCGNGSNLNLYQSVSWFMGDSATISMDGMPEVQLPIKDYSQWETWYDEQNFIYYHFWRIE